MFADVGKYNACGLFTIGHFILMLCSIIGIRFGLKFTYLKSKESVHKIIKNLAIVLLVLEILRIAYSLTQYDLIDVNRYLPLYYCSLLLFSLFLSGYAKGKLKRLGDVFIATGAIVGGSVFLILPTTSLPTYPAFHFVSIHSFLYHSVMIYIGILVNITNYVTITKKDIIYYASLVGLICLVALGVNSVFDSNLMFISENFPGTPIEYLYNFLNNKFLFSFIMILAQITLPFYIIEYSKKLYIDLGHLDKLHKKIEENRIKIQI